jgi:hypothetical protein
MPTKSVREDLEISTRFYPHDGGFVKRHIFLTILLLTSPAGASEGEAWEGLTLAPNIPTVEAATTNDFERLIREAYEGVETYSQASTPAEFSLSHFVTRPFEEVKGEPYPSLATPPGGEFLHLVRNILGYPDGSQVLSYDYRWKDGVTLSAASVEAQMLEHGSIGRFLDMASQDGTEFGHVRFVTQFHVGVEAVGRRRNYRAAVLWIPAASEDHWYLYPVDHVVTGLDTVGFEKIPPMTRTQRIEIDGGLEILSWQGEGAEQDEEGIGRSQTCSESLQRTSTSDYRESGSGHLAGKHWANWQGRFQCSCSLACQNSCRFLAGGSECEDSGLTLNACHKMAESHVGNTGTTSDGRSTSCTAGMGCAQKSCLGCACSFSITAKISEGVGVSLEPSDAAWSATLGQTHSCGACNQTCLRVSLDGSTEQVDCDPTTGGTAGGGAGQPCFLCTPIVLSLNDLRFDLTTVKDGVSFDLTSDHQPEQVSWTAAGSDEAFLVLDRNGNGVADGGFELFGATTTQITPNEGPLNGYQALRFFDDAPRGGNEDSRISAEDEIFSELRLWLDSDHDGVCAPEELRPLEEAGVVAIGLDTVVSQKRDRHGNLIRWRSKVEFTDGRTRLVAADVIFQKE